MLCCVVLFVIIAPVRRYIGPRPSGQQRSVASWLVLTAGVTALVVLEFGAAIGLSHLIQPAHAGAAHSMPMGHGQRFPATALPSVMPDLTTLLVIVVVGVCCAIALRPVGVSRRSIAVVLVYVLGTAVATAPAVRQSHNHVVQMLVLEYFSLAVPLTAALFVAASRRRCQRDDDGGRLARLFAAAVGSVAALWSLHVFSFDPDLVTLVVVATLPVGLVFWHTFIARYRDPFTRPAAVVALALTMEAGSLLGLALVVSADSAERFGAGLVMLVGDVLAGALLWATRSSWRSHAKSRTDSDMRVNRGRNQMEVV